MLDAIKTVNASRPDLAILEVNAPFGYIGNRIFPVAKVAGKTGTIYYQALVAHAAAQTGRSPGAAPNAVTLAEASSSFTAAEKIKRYKMPYEAVPLFGGVAKGDDIGGRAAKRSVMNAIETAQLAVLVDGAGTSITSAIIDGIISAADSVKRYSGKLAFVCSTGIYRYMIQQTEIKNLMVRSFGGLSAEQVLSLSPQVFKAMLQGLFLFDDVLIADDNVWPAAYWNTAAVCKIPDGTDELSFTVDPEIGRTFTYWPDGGAQFEINSFADDDVRANIYDATSYVNCVQLNAGAKSLVQLSNSHVTTTTATT
jgi:hypothetical protein